MRNKWLWVASPVPSDPAAPRLPSSSTLNVKFYHVLEGDALSLFGDPSTDKSAPEKGPSQGFLHAQEEAHAQQ